jgi:hypothetical protein
MDTAYISEMSLKLYQSTRRHNPENNAGLVTAVRTSDPARRKTFLFPNEIQRTGLKGLSDVTERGSSLPSDMSEPLVGVYHCC